jgi:dTDP-4-amino-4,6-dideoxygalactose transaminase
MPSVTLIGTAGASYALPAEELFVDAESVSLDISPQFIKEKTTRSESSMALPTARWS